MTTARLCLQEAGTGMEGELIANRYRILSKIGSGGMADVYKANDEVLNRIVAVKILRPEMAEDASLLVRFIREASAARKLKHPNVVSIYDVGENNGLHYIVMEYVDGITLKEMIQEKGPMPVRQSIDIMLQLCSAVQAAHDGRIIHRDIKPQNVLVCKDGTMKITDFGIAVSAESQLEEENSSAPVMGSAHYLAPESAAGKQPDYRVDIYALGIVFFELLTGSVPFTGSYPAQIALKHLQDPLPRIQPFNPGVCQSVENVVIKAAAKDPGERYQSVSRLKQAIEKSTDPALHAQPRLILKTQKVNLPERRIPVYHIPENPELQEQEALKKQKESLPPLKKAPAPSKLSWPDRLMLLTVSSLIVLLGAMALMAAGITPVNGWFGWKSIPNVNGMSEGEAIYTLTEAGFDQNLIDIRQDLSDTIMEGYAVGTEKPAGSLVRESDRLTLVVSKGPHYLISDYTGLYLSDVEKAFSDAGVRMQYMLESRGTADTNPGIILEQSGLNPGDLIDPEADSTITFVISAYPSIVLTEDLIGMNVNEAKEKLNAQGIAVLTVPAYGTDSVVSMDPPAGSTYTQQGTDSVVTLYH